MDWLELASCSIRASIDITVGTILWQTPTQKRVSILSCLKDAHCRKWTVILTKINVISVSPKLTLSLRTFSFKDCRSSVLLLFMYLSYQWIYPVDVVHTSWGLYLLAQPPVPKVETALSSFSRVLASLSYILQARLSIYPVRTATSGLMSFCCFRVINFFICTDPILHLPSSLAAHFVSSQLFSVNFGDQVNR